MSTLRLLMLLTGLGVTGALLVANGWMQPTPTLQRTLAHLGRRGTEPRDSVPSKIVRPIAELIGGTPRLLPSAAELRILQRSLDRHVLALVWAALAGALLPPCTLTALSAAGLVSSGWFVPVGVAIGGLVLGPTLVHTATVERAAERRTDLRYQVSAYLDVITMLLAGNTGYEGALEQAAHAGDGQLFAELRRRMREAGTRGLSMTDALRSAGRELGLDELDQIAATAALSAAEGAPVARTLAAKCATLRATLATEQESEARLRTSRLTTPIVGMALIFMGLVIYPALSFS